tara:strand:+ start:63 stop:497 length:435 start_codon:yes stop_codon:yes gene_type:complete
MAITQAMCTSFKKELLEAKHNFLLTGGNTFKIALFTSSASLGASTTVYASIGMDEITGTGYTAGGNTLTRVDPSSSGTTGLTDFADTSWGTEATFTARGALIYNAAGNRAVLVLDFGADKTVTASTFTIAFPATDGNNAIIRIV